MLDKRLVREAWKVKRYLGFVLGLGWLIALLSVLQAHYLSETVSQVFLPQAGFPLAGEALSAIKGLLLSLLVVVVVRALAQGVSEVLALEGAALIKEGIRERLVGRLLELGPVYAKGERSGEVLNTLVEGVDALEDYFAHYLPQLVLAILIPATVLLFAFPVDLTSGLILLFTLPLLPLFMLLIGKLAEKKAEAHWQEMSRMSAHFLDVLQGLTTLKMFGRSKSQSAVISRVSDDFRGATLDVLRVAFLSAMVLELLATLSTALLAVALGLRLVSGGISFAAALFLLLLAPELYQPLRALAAQFHASLGGVGAAKRIFAILTEVSPMMPEPARGQSRTGEACSGSSQFDFRGPIVCRSVSYTYPGRARPSLAEASLILRPGERVALTGVSGAGKSTLLQLMLGFIRPDRGGITVNGRPLPELAGPDWRRQVAYVSQHPHLFSGSVYENILIGRRDASRAEVLQAAQRAGADEFICGLGAGYETLVGENGVRLSGGQIQRLAMARAFLRDTEFLFLDEPFAGLDAVSEKRLSDNLELFSRGRTVLLITHRKQAVAWVDRVLSLQRGKVGQEATQMDGERWSPLDSGGALE